MSTKLYEFDRLPFKQDKNRNIFPCKTLFFIIIAIPGTVLKFWV